MDLPEKYIVDPQSVADFICPRCEKVVYPDPDGAVMAYCSHIYCKRCLARVVATTKVCPRDSSLVTEADSEFLARAQVAQIAQMEVRCIFYEAGCPWQGPLAQSASHTDICLASDICLAQTEMRCIFYRIGCRWQGPLAQLASHMDICSVAADDPTAASNIRMSTSASDMRAASRMRAKRQQQHLSSDICSVGDADPTAASGMRAVSRLRAKRP